MVTFLQQWLTPAALGAVAWALVQHFLQKRQHRSSRLLDMRAEKYQSYLGTLEAISQATNLELQTRVFEAMPARLAAILTQPDAADAILVEMTSDFSKLLSRMSDAVARASDDLQGLKLVSSPEVLCLLEEYISLQRQLYLDATSIAASWSRSGISSAVPTPSQETIVRAGRAEELLHLIIRQMRKELGTDK